MTIVEVLRRVAPRARSNYVDAFARGDALLQAHGIATPLRSAHFVAQVLHETAGLSVLRERMKYSAARLLEVFGVNRHSAAITPAEAQELAGNEEAIAERVYGLGNPLMAQRLGNTEPGDGFRYRGTGLLQTTGRVNHRRAGLACGLDLEREPDLATAPDYALQPAVQQWTEDGLNAAADRNDIVAITRSINGGFNGFPERQAWFDRLWPLLRPEGCGQDAWEIAEPDPSVRWLQTALNALGARPSLAVDGRLGAATREAVKAFQRTAAIPVDGIAGPVTEAAVRLRLATVGP